MALSPFQIGDLDFDVMMDLICFFMSLCRRLLFAQILRTFNGGRDIRFKVDRWKAIYLRVIGSGVKMMSKAKLTPTLGKIDDNFPCKHLTVEFHGQSIGGCILYPL